jgi:hypothetical protein
MRPPLRRLSTIFKDLVVIALKVCSGTVQLMNSTVDSQMGGTQFTHLITINPKTFFAWRLSPMIRRQLPGQTIGAMEKLRVYLAAASEANTWANVHLFGVHLRAADCPLLFACCFGRSFA